MHRSYIFLFALSLLAHTVFAQTSQGMSSDKGTSSPSSSRLVIPQVSYSKTVSSTAGEPIYLSLEGLVLIADSGQLMHDVEFSVSTLHDGLASLQSGMVNITGGAKAYRLLPHGEHFSSPALLRLAYEPAMLPHGFRPADIYTYYYDELASRWIQLERVTVDTLEHVIVSRTTHFTDFINAVIRTPEMPEVSAFVPTQLADMEAPSPLIGVQMLAEPQANPYGNVSLEYPLALPAGRNGMQPDFSLTYNSANGDGILGYGWSIPQPAITIDTRWGVPRYDADYETEIYTLDGEQLVQVSDNDDLKLSYQNHTLLERWGHERQFVIRNTRKNDRVIRYGNNPTNYWWKVIRSDGTSWYYGKYSNSNDVVDSCVLRDANNNIGYWALCEIEDLSGNFIMYEYEKDEDDNEIYLTTIRYTGHRQDGTVDLFPTYSIVCSYKHRNSSYPYEPYIIDGRLGFIRKTNRDICYIGINHTPETHTDPYSIRRYDFIYGNTNGGKRMITKVISERDFGPYIYRPHDDPYWRVHSTSECDDHDVVVIDTTAFEYYQQPFSQIFSEHEDTITDLHAQDKNFLDLSLNKSWNLGGTLSVGFGADPWNSNIGVGGNYNYSESVGRNLYQLLDLDGDGLADKVYSNNDSIFFRKHIINNNRHYFDTAQYIGIKSANLSKENSKTNNLGLQAGVEPVVHASGGWSSTDSYTNCFFADVNADGLPDFVDNEVVYFNRINTPTHDFLQYNGINPNVSVNPDACSSYFYYDGEVELDSRCYVDTVVLDSFTIVPPVFSDPYGDCWVFYESFLCEGDSSYWEWCQECIQNGVPVNVECNTSALEECLECYILYGDDAEKYSQCADTVCLFAGQEAVCETCRSACEISPELCTQCVNDYCIPEPENIKNVIEGCEICDSCLDACANGIYTEECNRCKHRNHCKGVINPEVLTRLQDPNVDTAFYQLAQMLFEEEAICEECVATCMYNPAQCIPCLHRHCYYQDIQYLIDEMVDDSLTRMMQDYPSAKFYRKGNTYFLYETQTVCLEEDFNSITPDIEAVRVWVAPRSGMVNLTSNIQLLQDTTTTRKQSRTADGVRCIIQHNHGIDTTTIPNRLRADMTRMIDAVNISATDYNLHSRTYQNIQVSAGDIFFFHLMSRSSHSFDNVNWEQTFRYSGFLEKTYSSNDDYTCSGQDVFCPDTAAGTIRIQFNATTLSEVSAIVIVNQIDNTNNSISPIYMQPVTSANMPLPDCVISNLQPNKTYSIDVSGTNLAQLELRPHITHIRPSKPGAGNDTINTYQAPRLLFSPEMNLDSTYYDLFGPLYKGWGQFAINNLTASDMIILDSLYNNSKLYATKLNNLGQVAFEAAFQDVDSASMSTPGSMENYFRTKDLYNPIDSTCLWVEMKADAKNYRWEAYGRVARNGRSLLSNTRDRKASFSYFSDNSMDNHEWEVYDNVVPVVNEPHRRVTTIRKMTNNQQWNASWGVGMGYISGGQSLSKGTFKICADYLDMNGDRFPDILQGASIQYSYPWGGLGGKVISSNTTIHTAQQYSYGQSFSGSSPKIFSIPSNKPSNNKFETSTSGTTGMSASGTIMESKVLNALKDVNGDGLPDKIYVSGDSVKVYLNIGYDFQYAGSIRNMYHLGMLQSLCANKTVSLGADYGGEREVPNTQISKFQVSLSIGVSGSCSKNGTTSQLVDIDGDGLMDKVQMAESTLIIKPAVYYANRPPQSAHKYNAYLQYSQTNSAGLELAVTGGFSIGIVKLCGGINGSPVSKSETIGEYDLIDMNGDGLPDLVRNGANGIYVRYNQMGRDGLLKSVTNPTGNQIRLTYRLSDPSIHQPNRQWLMDSVINTDIHAPLGGRYVGRHYKYFDPYYNPEERTSYGYGCVITEDLDRDSDGIYTVYRKHIKHYNNKDYVERGKLIADSLVDASGNVYIAYEIGTRYVDGTGNATDDICHDTKVRVGQETHYTRYYEGGDQPIVTAKQYDYDRYYNVTQYRNLGDTAVRNDDFTAHITFASATSGFNKAHNLVSLPTAMSVVANGVTLRQTKAAYEEGKLSVYSLINPQDATDSISTSYTYDQYGMLSYVLLPPNHNEDRMYYDIQYDDYSHSLPVSVANPFGTSETVYSPKWQLPLSVTDVSGATISYAYDMLGRVTSITSPGEDSLGINTITYDYHPQLGHNSYNNISNPYAGTSYIDIKTYMGVEDSTYQRVFYDARGREIQRLKRRGDMWAVTNAAYIDNFGRERETYINQLIPFDNNIYSFATLNIRVLYHEDFDILDRPISKMWGDSNASTIAYGIDEDVFDIRRLRQIREDENHNEWQIYTDPQNQPTTTISPEQAVTTFQYDPLGLLLSTTDPDGLTTTYQYDAYGRKRSRTHPDAGSTLWTYDKAGNVIASSTQRQLKTGVPTEYRYVYNRLAEIVYPQNPYNNVHYTYDDAGRVIQRIDATGYENFSYDALGNMTSSERLIALPTEKAPYTFTTRYRYDSFGKMRQIVYPDNEVVDYRYQDGLLKSIAGYQLQLGGDSNRYVSNIIYDEYDRPVESYYGNNDMSIYTYDSERQWLSGVELQSGNNNTLQELIYTYDGVGNIVEIEQSAGMVNGMGGSWKSTYLYDNQNRLTEASQTSSDLGDYSYAVTYSPAGRIGRKQSDAGIDLYYGYYANQDFEIFNHQIATIYDNVLGEAAKLYWDADGQLTRFYNPCSGEVRQHLWSDAGQLVASVDNQYCAFYAYDGNGARTYKLTGHSAFAQVNAGDWYVDLSFDDHTVIYVNPYMILSDQGITKHYYNGAQRVATQISDPFWLPSGTIVEPDGAEYAELAQFLLQATMEMYEPDDEPIEGNNIIIDIEGNESNEVQPNCLDDWRVIDVDYYYLDEDRIRHVLEGGEYAIATPIIYYYHSDHLGSASWITDNNGEPIQYIHYMPYGELWVNQRHSTYDERYKFTGKERDEETGYDFFGARNYSSAITSWLSVDPLSDKYPSISSYAYCNWNPLKYVDPDGREKHIFASNRESNPARNFKDDDGIYFYAHGSIKGYIKNDCGVATLNEEVYSNDLAKYVTDKSNQWKKDAAEGNTSMVFLYACHAGEGDNSLAQQLSEQLNDHETYVIGPMSLLYSEKAERNDAEYMGVASPRSYLFKRPWGVYQNGKLVTTIRGGKCPNKETVKEAVNRQLYLDHLWQSIKNFFKHDNE